jgi:hypothetical protein
MALILSTIPNQVYFAQNIVELEFSALEKFTTNGSIAKVTFSIGSPTTSGNGFNFTTALNGSPFAIDILFKGSPDPLLYELPLYDGSSDYAIFLQTVIDLLTGHPDLSEAFSFGLSPTNDKIVAQGLFMDLNTPIVTGIGVTASYVNDNLGQVPVSLPNYRMRLWLIIGNEMESDYTDSYKTPEIELDPDYRGDIYARLNQYLDSIISLPEPLPATDLIFNPAKYVNRPVTVVAGSKWGEPILNQKGNVMGKFRVLQGGMAPADYLRVISDIALCDFLGAHFLTNRKSRYVAANQPDYLFYYSDQDLPNANLKVRATFFSDPTETVTRFTFPLSMNRTYGINTQLDILAPNSLWTSNEEVSKIEIYIDDENIGTQTEMIDFYPEKDFQSIWFEYRNTFGVPETIKFSGDYFFYHQITKQEFDRDLPWDASIEDPTFLSALETNSLLIDVSTGPLRVTDIKAYVELLSSRTVFMLISNERIPVRIVSKEAISNKQAGNLSTVYATTFTAKISKSKGSSRNSF